MRHIEFQTSVPGRSAAEVFPVLCDFERFPDRTSAVRSVRVERVRPERLISKWEVSFRSGILCWTEEDRLDPTAHTITFRLLEGDMESLAGSWTLRDSETGCLICFTADFDLGIPSLADTLESIAERALRENVALMVAGVSSAVAENHVAGSPA